MPVDALFLSSWPCLVASLYSYHRSCLPSCSLAFPPFFSVAAEGGERPCALLTTVFSRLVQAAAGSAERLYNVHRSLAVLLGWRVDLVGTFLSLVAAVHQAHAAYSGVAPMGYTLTPAAVGCWWGYGQGFTLIPVPSTLLPTC